MKMFILNKEYLLVIDTIFFKEYFHCTRFHLLIV